MSYLPCENKACPSYGKPHPNCRCHGGLAEGGEVKPFCSESRPHEPGCEYFAEGGDTLPEGFTVDQAPEEAPPDALPEGFKLDEETADVPAGFQLDDDKYGTPDQTALAGVEGAVQGFLGPLGQLAEKMAPVTMPGAEEMLSPEAQAARRAANPVAFHGAEAATLVGGLMTGAGQGKLVGDAAKAVTGSKVLRGAIEGGLFAASDEASKWMLGQGDPQDAAGAAMSIGASALFGTLAAIGGQGAKQAATAGLKEIAEAKFGQKAMSFLQGVATAAKSQEAGARQEASAIASKSYGVNMNAFKAGQKLFDNIFLASGATIGAVKGYQEDGIWGAVKGLAEGSLAGYAGGKAAAAVGPRVIAPALMKVLSSGKAVGIAEALDHAAQMAQQSKLIDTGINGLFDLGPVMSQQAINAYGSDALHKDLDTFIGNGGITQNVQQQIYQENAAQPVQGFAEGGEVKADKKEKAPKDQPAPLLRPDDGVAIHYPEHNMLLSAARGRVSNYLTMLRPQPHQPKLPFDDAPDDREQKKAYKVAMHVAARPLGILGEIKAGTIEPDHIKHLTAMYPELGNLLQKRITQRIVKDQMEGKKPSFKVRQGLSMLMGAPLSGEFLPQNIQAAQSVFAKGAPPQQSSQPQAKQGRSSSKLPKSDQAYLTGEQALVRRSQKI